MALSYLHARNLIKRSNSGLYPYCLVDGTNHIDNPSVWPVNRLYQGEMFVDTLNNRIYYAFGTNDVRLIFDHAIGLPGLITYTNMIENSHNIQTEDLVSTRKIWGYDGDFIHLSADTMYAVEYHGDGSHLTGLPNSFSGGTRLDLISLDLSEDLTCVNILAGFITATQGVSTSYIMQSNGSYSMIIDGQDNDIDYQTVQHGLVAGGKTNQIIENSDKASIIGGEKGTIQDSSHHSGIFCGDTNMLEGNSWSSTILGASGATITGSDRSSIVGGYSGKIFSSANATLIGGDNNELRSSSNSSMIGGSNNIVDNDANIQVIGCKSRVNDVLTTPDTTYVENLKSFGSVSATTFVGDGSQLTNVIYTGGTHLKVLSISQTVGDSLKVSTRNSTIEGLVSDSVILGGNGLTLNSYRSVLIGGENNKSTDSNDSSIIGGENNYQNATNSHMIGCSSRTGLTSNTTYVENLKSFGEVSATTLKGDGTNITNVLHNNTAITATTLHANLLYGDGSHIINLPIPEPTPIFTGGTHLEVLSLNKTNGHSLEIATRNSTLNSVSDSVILGGNGNSQNSDRSVLIGGENNKSTDSNDSSIIGGENNYQNATNSHMIGCNTRTGLTSNTVYIENLQSFGEVSATTLKGDGINITNVLHNNTAITATTLHANTLYGDGSHITNLPITPAFTGGTDLKVLSLNSTSTKNSLIIGGTDNAFDTNTPLNESHVDSVILGGHGNKLSGSTEFGGIIYSAIIAGFNNINHAGGNNVIIGGQNNKQILSSNCSIEASHSAFMDEGYASSIIASTNSHMQYGTTTVIIGGENNYMYNKTNTIMLGCSTRTGLTSNTTYTENLKAFGNITGTTFYGDGSKLTGILTNGGVAGNNAEMVTAQASSAFTISNSDKSLIIGSENIKIDTSYNSSIIGSNSSNILPGVYTSTQNSILNTNNSTISGSTLSTIANSYLSKIDYSINSYILTSSQSKIYNGNKNVIINSSLINLTGSSDSTVIGCSSLNILNAGNSTYINCSYTGETSQNQTLHTDNLYSVQNLTFRPIDGDVLSFKNEIGNLCYDANDNKLKYHNGTEWKTIATTV